MQQRFFAVKMIVVLILAPVMILMAISAMDAAHRRADSDYFTLSGNNCGADFPTIPNAFEKHDLTDPLGLLAGVWNTASFRDYRAVISDTGDVILRGLLGTITVVPGTDFYTVPVAGCNYTFDLTGIKVGDAFVISEPCMVDVNQVVEIEAKLTDENDDVEDPHPVLSPASMIADRMSEFHVRRHDGGAYTPHRFEAAGEEIPDGFITFDQYTNPLEFKLPDDGLYEVEWIWNMPSPPSSFGTTEVSRASTKILVGSYQAAMRQTGFSATGLENEICPTPGKGCNLTEKAFSWLEGRTFNFGVTHCDGKGGFRTTVKSRDSFKGLTDLFAPRGASDGEKDDYAAMAQECMQEHENGHIKWLTDPANNFQDVCKGCCCVMLPKGNKEECKRSEKRAFLEEMICIRDKWRSAAAGTHEKDFLKDYMEHRREEASNPELCKT